MSKITKTLIKVGAGIGVKIVVELVFVGGS
jgi:hypothetical protein